MQTTFPLPLALDAPGFLIPRTTNDNRAAVLDWAEHVAAGRIPVPSAVEGGTPQLITPENAAKPCPERSRRVARWDALLASARWSGGAR